MLVPAGVPAAWATETGMAAATASRTNCPAPVADRQTCLRLNTKRPTILRGAQNTGELPNFWLIHHKDFGWPRPPPCRATRSARFWLLAQTRRRRGHAVDRRRNIANALRRRPVLAGRRVGAQGSD